jgi:hypothetical protein
MKTRWIVLFCIALELVCRPPAFAQPFNSAQSEINYLLDYVEISGCEFYRNGSWYDSLQARQHLRTKFEYFAARKGIETAEEFIDKAASKSSLSGHSYEVRCGDCTSIATGAWLSAVLARYRVVAKRASGTP